MYNQSIKEDYINYYMSMSQAADMGSRRRQVERFFIRLGKVEQSFDVDIADADYETAVLILNQIGKGGARNDGNGLAIYKQYIDWAIESGHSRNFENNIYNITAEDLDKSATYRATMVKDEKELVDYLDVCFSDINSDSVDIVFRTYVILIFNGVDPTLALELLSDSVDLSLKTICVNGIVINLSNTACTYINILSNIENYIVDKGDFGVRVISKANTGHLLETSNCNRDRFKVYFANTLSSAARRYYTATNIKKSLNSITIYKSGIFYRAWLRELKCGKINLDEYFRFKKLSKKIARGKLLIEYNNWKKAFNL